MTLLWQVQERLVTLFTAAVTVPVYDAGSLVGDDAGEFVTVGEPGENGDTATSELVLSSMGNDWHEESGEVPCMVTVWSGDTAIAPLRASAKTLLDALVAAVRADPDLTGLLIPPGRADVTAVRLREGQTDRGLLVEAGFTVTFTALIVS